MSDSARPLILVSADQRPLDGYVWHAAIDTYTRALHAVGETTPVIVPALGPSMVTRDLIEAASGLLLTGARSNVHPGLYGTDPSPQHEPYDPARDATTMPLIHAALEAGMPLFAICRGHQELNVALGGSLEIEIQEQEGRNDHRGGPVDAPPETRFALNHPVHVRPGGVLHDILGETTITVNSVHRQAIGCLADDLVIEADADDGTIEAVSVKGAKGFTLGLQWHPEHWVSRSADHDHPSTTIFRAFAEAARAYRAGRSQH